MSDSLTVGNSNELIANLIQQAAQTSPTQGNGYGLALASFLVIIVFFALGMVYFIRQASAREARTAVRNKEYQDELNDQRKEARERLSAIITGEIASLKADTGRTLDQLRMEMQVNRDHVNRVDQDNARLVEKVISLELKIK